MEKPSFFAVIIIGLLLCSPFLISEGATSTCSYNNKEASNSTTCADNSCTQTNDTCLNGICNNISTCPTGNCNSTSTCANCDLIYPTNDQLMQFLSNDTTDMANLADDEATKQLASNAVNNNKFHTQILLIVFNNGQLFAVNRFRLADGNFVYVDCSKPLGIENNTGCVNRLDRIINVKNNIAITGNVLCDQNLSVSYPTSTVEYAVPMWSV